MYLCCIYVAILAPQLIVQLYIYKLLALVLISFTARFIILLKPK